MTTLCPGSVSTDFQARAGIKPGLEHEMLDISASDVAQAGYRGLMANKRVVLPVSAQRLFRLCCGFFRAGLSWQRSIAFNRDSANKVSSSPQR